MGETPAPETKMVHVLLAIEVPASWDPMRMAANIAAQYESNFHDVTYPPVVRIATDLPALGEFVDVEARSAALERAADELRSEVPDKAEEFREAQREFLLIQELRAGRRNHLPRLLLQSMAGGGAWRGLVS